MTNANEDSKTITIRSVNTGASMQGGAWKVAYADFVTAMMAFFLLLWLLNVTTAEQRDAISNYFDPTHPKVSSAQSGAGGVMGGLSVSMEGAMTTNRQPLNNVSPSGTAPSSTTKNPRQNKQQLKREEIKKILQKQEEETFKKAQEKLKQAIEADPNLKDLSKNLMIDMTPEGLRIQIVDEEERPMFALGSADMFDYTQELMGKIAGVINEMANEISVRGHTDSIPYGAGADYTNWELSTDRANSSRRVLKDGGVPEERLHNVVGKADTEHLLPDDPTNARNRRISIVLLKEAITNPEYDKEIESLAEDEAFLRQYGIEDEVEEKTAPPPPVGTFQRTPGSVEFP